jgi:phage tail-like protein
MTRDEIERLLPSIFQRTATSGTPLAALLEVMERMHAPAEAALASLHVTLDPRTAPDRFLPFLARWVDMDPIYTEGGRRGGAVTLAAVASVIDPGRLRELLAQAAYLAQRRGTRAGLLCFLETATWVAGFRIDERVTDERGRVRPFHFRVHAPAAAAPREALVRRIIELEKPAYVTYDLRFGVNDSAREER